MAKGFNVQKVDGRYWADIEQMIRVVNSAIQQSSVSEPMVSLVNLAAWLDNSIQNYDEAQKGK